MFNGVSGSLLIILLVEKELCRVTINLWKGTKEKKMTQDGAPLGKGEIASTQPISKCIIMYTFLFKVNRNIFSQY